MKKLFFILLISMSCAYGQARQSIPDTLRAHLAAIQSKAPRANATFTGTTTVPALTLSGNASAGTHQWNFGSSNQFLITQASTSILFSTTEIDIMTTHANGIVLNFDGTNSWGVTTNGIIPSVNSAYNLGSASYNVADLYVDTVKTDGVILGGTVLTPTATELNYVDGATSSLQTQINAISSAQGATIVDSIQAQTQTRNFVIGYPQTGAAKVPLQVGNVTLTDVKGVLVGGTSVKFTMYYGPNVSLTGTEVFDDYVTCTSTTTAQDLSGTLITGSLDIDTDEYLWLEVDTVTGTVEVMTITVKFIGRD